MDEQLLQELLARLELEDGLDLEQAEGGLVGSLALTYGDVPLRIDLEQELLAMRVGVRVPPPAGAGPGFLVWALALNPQYWDVKIGLDDAGMLLVHADVDLSLFAFPGDLSALGRVVSERVEVMRQVLDAELLVYIREQGLATPGQAQRWGEDDEEV